MPQTESHRTWGLGLVVLVLALAAFLGFAIWAAVKLWALAGDTRMSVHGWIAMGLAGGLTLIIGGGLMWLAFYSARKGYDERAGDMDEPEG
jgi:TRAP-type C4-dicarboxylate transport system permease small subunit